MMNLDELSSVAGVPRSTIDGWRANGCKVLPASLADGPAPQRRFLARHALYVAAFAYVARMADYRDAMVMLDALRAGFSHAQHGADDIALSVARSPHGGWDYYAGSGEYLAGFLRTFGPGRSVTLWLNELFQDCRTRARLAGLEFPDALEVIANES
ncbi:MAG: hypothetical protein KDE63_09380 [Novosphingobium sp.]|nr:hypothetical protein [Novosphingobium sp.]